MRGKKTTTTVQISTACISFLSPLLHPPFPHFEARYPTHPLSCFSDVEDFIFEAARSEHIEVIRGADLIDANPKLFADDDHPNVHGATQIASRLADALKEVSKTFERF